MDHQCLLSYSINHPSLFTLPPSVVLVQFLFSPHGIIMNEESTRLGYIRWLAGYGSDANTVMYSNYYEVAVTAF